MGREYDRVTFLDTELVMLAAGQTAQNGRRLALRAGHHDHHLARRQVHRLAQIDDQIVGQFEIAQLAGDLDGIAHGSSGNGHLAVELERGGSDDLNP